MRLRTLLLAALLVGGFIYVTSHSDSPLRRTNAPLWSEPIVAHSAGLGTDAAVFAELPARPGKPTLVIAHTTKGKGVSFMENTVLWHYRTARGEEFDRALKELEAH